MVVRLWLLSIIYKDKWYFLFCFTCLQNINTILNLANTILSVIRHIYCVNCFRISSINQQYFKIDIDFSKRVLNH